ncbi:hypothetical protein CIK76_17030 [Glutamicibacter sp. BW80]|uniref:response regulator transcription factor n=1 Tax=Glutamicibacter sp. BW80 TaxID=2024404 RepID=UPI000BB8F70F|nr:helix-turn-helix transcriptional regulator [Glutamicibacter sp. BW80]PCC27453.1 hypothetical protein CIK76_17030 [Glutamicibacter sp. BW80]
MGGFVVSTMWLDHWDGLRQDCWRSESQLYLFRADVQDRLRRMVQERTPGGFVLRGGQGTGKREVVRVAFEHTDAGIVPIWVSGSRYGSEKSYGAIQFLLTGLPDAQLNSPLAVFGHLKSYFELCAPKAVVIVEHLGLIDPLTTAVLSQLVSNGLVRLILLEETIDEMPQDLSVLVRMGTIEMIHLDSLTLQEARTEISLVLGRDVSYLTSFHLWRYCGGSSEVLRAVVSDCQNAQAFQVTDRFAALKQGALPIGLHTEHYVQSQLQQLSPDQRAILDSVAISGEIAKSIDSSSQALDFLVSRELLDRPGKKWSIPNPAIAHTIASWQGQPAFNAAELPMDGPCQRGVVQRERSLPERAIKFQNGQDSQFEEPSCTGQITGAIELFAARPELGLAIEHMAAQSNEHLIMLERLLEESRMHEAEKVVNELRPNGRKRLWEDLDHCQQHLALALIALYSVRVNDQNTARALVDAILADVVHESPSNQAVHYKIRLCMGRTVRALISTCLALRDWGQCRNLIQLVLDGAVDDHRLLTFAEAAHALLLAIAGNETKAREIGQPLRLQVLHSGTIADLRLVDAMINGVALADSDSGDAPDSELDRSSNGCARIGIDMCVGQLLLNRADLRMVSELSEWAETQGEKLLASLLLAQQICRGDFHLTSRLAALQNGFEHPLANSLRMLALGVDNADTMCITAQLGRLIELGFISLADGSEAGIYGMLNGGQKRQLARSAGSFIAKIKPSSAGSDTFASLVSLTVLTEREKFVASAAAMGLSNQEIAKQASVSVRTVEGHLYQVYSKLGISKRADLKLHAGADEK